MLPELTSEDSDNQSLKNCDLPGLRDSGGSHKTGHQGDISGFVICVNPINASRCTISEQVTNPFNRFSHIISITWHLDFQTEERVKMSDRQFESTHRGKVQERATDSQKALKCGVFRANDS